MADELYISGNEAAVETYLGVFEKIFRDMGHGAHYEMMSGAEQMAA